MPLWLAPQQVVVATIVSEADEYAEEIILKLKDKGIRCEADLRNEKISYKVREHSLRKVPIIFAIGKKEIEENTVSVRRIGTKDSVTKSLAEVVEEIAKENSI